MIKLKDLIIETWNSNIWMSDLWNSDIWPSHIWEGEKKPLNEILDFRNFWVLPDGRIEEVDDHISWFVTETNQDKYQMDDDGYPLDEWGAIAEPSDVYTLASEMGYIRITQEIKNNGPLEFDYVRDRPPTQRQLKSMKDLAIENRVELKNAVTDRMIDLS